MSKIKKFFTARTFLSVGVLFLLFGMVTAVPNSAEASSFQNVSGWAYSRNVGWISFNSLDCDPNQNGVYDDGVPQCPTGGTVPDYGVSIDRYTGNFSGYAWNAKIGWISFNASDSNGICPASAQFDVAGGSGKITGFARALSGNSAQSGGWDGCVGLSDSQYFNSPDASGAGGVTHISASKKLVGYAWGDKVLGWVQFYDVKVGDLTRPYISIHPQLGTNTGVKIQTPAQPVDGSTTTGVGLTLVNDPKESTPTITIETKGVTSCKLYTQTHPDDDIPPYVIKTWDNFGYTINTVATINPKLKPIQDLAYNKLYDTSFFVQCDDLDNRTYIVEAIVREIYNDVKIDLQASVNGQPVSQNPSYQFPVNTPVTATVPITITRETSFINGGSCNIASPKSVIDVAPTGGKLTADTNWDTANGPNDSGTDTVSVAAQPVGMYTYTLTCTGNDGVAHTDSVTVTVLPGGLVAGSVDVKAGTPGNPGAAQDTYTIQCKNAACNTAPPKFDLYWNNQNVSQCAAEGTNADNSSSAGDPAWDDADGDIIGSSLNSGSLSPYLTYLPAATGYTFTLRCLALDNTTVYSDTATVYIKPFISPDVTITANGTTGTVTVPYNSKPQFVWQATGASAVSCEVGPSNTHNTSQWFKLPEAEWGPPATSAVTADPWPTQSLSGVSGSFNAPNALSFTPVPLRYAVLCRDANGTPGKEATVDVTVNPPPSATIVAIDSNGVVASSSTTLFVNAGDKATIQWWSSGVSQSCKIGPTKNTGVWSGQVLVGGVDSSVAGTTLTGGTPPPGHAGAFQTPNAITSLETYAVQCYDIAGNPSLEVFVNVDVKVPTAIITANGVAGSTTVNYGDTPTIAYTTSLDATMCFIGPSNSRGPNVYAHWNTPPAPSVNANPNTKLPAGQQTFTVPYGLSVVSTYTYGIYCQNAAGIKGPESTVNVIVNPPPAATVTITANGQSGKVRFPSGTQPTIAWTASPGTKFCRIGPSNSYDPARPNGQPNTSKNSALNAHWPASVAGTVTAFPSTVLLTTSGTFSFPTPYVITKSVYYAVQCYDQANKPGAEASVILSPMLPPTVILDANGSTGTAVIVPGTKPNLTWWASSSAVSCEIGPSNTATGSAKSGSYWDSSVLVKNQPATDKIGTLLSTSSVPPGIQGSNVPTGNTIGSARTYAVLCRDAWGGATEATVNLTMVPPPTTTITATPNPVIQNQQTIIAWSSPTAVSCEIATGNVGTWNAPAVTTPTSTAKTPLASSGQFPSSPIVTQQLYRVRCIDANNLWSPVASVTVTPTAAPIIPPVATINATATTVQPGGTTNIVWWADSNATSCIIGQGNTGGAQWSVYVPSPTSSQGTGLDMSKPVPWTFTSSGVATSETYAVQCFNQGVPGNIAAVTVNAVANPAAPSVTIRADGQQGSLNLSSTQTTMKIDWASTATGANDYCAIGSGNSTNATGWPTGNLKTVDNFTTAIPTAQARYAVKCWDDVAQLWSNEASVDIYPYVPPTPSCNVTAQNISIKSGTPGAVSYAAKINVTGLFSGTVNLSSTATGVAGVASQAFTQTAVPNNSQSSLTVTADTTGVAPGTYPVTIGVSGGLCNSPQINLIASPNPQPPLGTPVITEE